MNLLAILFVFSCGVSVGILIGRADARKKMAADDAATPVTTAAVLAPPPAPVQPPTTPVAPPVAPPPPVVEPELVEPEPVVETRPVVEPGPGAEAGEPVAVESTVAAALTEDPLAPLPKPPPVITKKGRKVGIDETTLTVSDDILERLRRAEELGVDPAEARSLIERSAPATPPPPPPTATDPALAAAERRVLERLRAQERAAEREGDQDDRNP